MRRRDFLKGTAGLSALMLLTKCGGGGGSSGGSGGGGSGGGGGGGSGYVPQVDFPPDKSLGYFIAGGSVDEAGVSYQFGVKCVEPNRDDIALYGYFREADNWAGVVQAIDERNEYLPKLVPVSGSTSKPGTLKKGGESGLEALTIKEFTMRPLNSAIRYGANKYLDFDTDQLPVFDVQNYSRTPEGHVYLGDWSFRDLKNLNTGLKNMSRLSIAFVPQIGVPSYSFFSLTGAVLDTIEDGIEVINDVFNEDIDLDEKYPVYIMRPAALASSFADFPILFVSRVPRSLSHTVPIQRLYNLRMGNSWTYDNGGGTISVDWAPVKGEALLGAASMGGSTKEYFGSYGNEFRYYGFWMEGLGDVMFDPAIVVGNEYMKTGSSHRTVTNVRVLNYPQISGTADSTFQILKREQIILPSHIRNGVFGDCFKQREYDSLSLKNDDTGETASSSVDQTAWLAENVGRVKVITNEGKTHNLSSSTFAPLKPGEKGKEGRISRIPEQVAGLMSRLGVGRAR